MKISQEQPEFKPLIITLETPEEVSVFWGILDGEERVPDLVKSCENMRIQLSNWISNRARF